MQKSVRTLYAADQQATWAASARKTIRLPLDRWTMVAMLRCTFTYDTAAAAAVAQDGVLNAIQSLTLKVNGKPRRTITPTRSWYLLPLDLGVKPEFVDATTAVANGKTASFTFPLYFRLDPANENDLSALLPSHRLSSLEVEVLFGATGALGANQTLTAGTVDVQLKEIDLSDGEELALYGASGEAVVRKGSRLLEVLESETTKVVDAAYADYKFAIPLPTGGILVRTAVFTTLNGARDDTLATSLKVRNEPAKYDYYEATWAHSQEQDLQEYAPNSIISGNRYLIGLTMLDHVEYGPLDLRAARTDSHNVRFTTIAPVGTTNIVLVNKEIGAAAYASG